MPGFESRGALRQTSTLSIPHLGLLQGLQEIHTQELMIGTSKPPSTPKPETTDHAMNPPQLPKSCRVAGTPAPAHLQQRSGTSQTSLGALENSIIARSYSYIKVPEKRLG